MGLGPTSLGTVQPTDVGVIMKMPSPHPLLPPLTYPPPESPLDGPLSPAAPQCVLSYFSRVRLFATLWAVARQAPLSMEFSGQEYWSGLPRAPLQGIFLGLNSCLLGLLGLLHHRQILDHRATGEAQHHCRSDPHSPFSTSFGVFLCESPLGKTSH